MSTYLNALAEEGTREDLLAQVTRLIEEQESTAAAHTARVAELLETNNREVERRRIAERALDASSFQRRVGHWMQACFGPAISADRLERGDRLLEEVLELLQSGGYPPERVASLTGYVWSRPAGEPPQEVGGVEVTLAAYCLAHGLDKHEAGETELARIWTKVEAIRAKQAAKPTGSALPMAWANPAALARVAIPELKLYPAEPNALRNSIAELDAWLDSSDALDEIENQQSFGESIMLVVHELKRLQALAAEPAPAQPVAVPDGWVLVPREPTQEMVTAGADAAERNFTRRTRAPATFKAMLSAAPLPPDGGDVRLRAGWMLMNDNGKRWRICGPAGRWVMKPEGAITADEARTICETAMGTALAHTPAPQPDGAAEADELAEILGDILREAISERGMGWCPRAGNAPGHGHETTGIWDDDNGPLSGKPCKWCAAWKRGLDTLHARAKRTANQKDS